MKEIVIIGAGNFGREVAWLIEDINKSRPSYIVLGYLDDTPEKQGETINGYKVLGPVAVLPELVKNHNACAVIAIQNSEARERICGNLSHFNNWETLIHPSVNRSDTSKIGQGSIICAGVNISVNTIIGNQCIVNIGSVIENDCTIENYVSIMCKSVVGSNSHLMNHAYIGSNSSVVNGKKVGINAQVGPGSVVIGDIPDNTTVIGVPAKRGLFDNGKYSYL